MIFLRLSLHSILCLLGLITEMNGGGKRRNDPCVVDRRSFFSKCSGKKRACVAIFLVVEFENK